MSDKLTTPEEVFGKIILDRDNGVQTIRDNNLTVACQAYEECAKLACSACRDTGPPTKISKKGWRWHVFEGGKEYMCAASAIHALSDDKLMGGVK